MMRNIFIMVALIVALTINATERNYQKEAIEAYNNKNYPAAIEAYDSLMKQGVSSELYYNLGNCYYRSGNKGMAVLYYEKALKLEPDNRMAKANLDFIHTKLIDPYATEENIIVVGYRSVRNWLSSSGWTIAGMVFFALFILALGLYMFASSIIVRKSGFFGGFAMLALCIAANVIAADAESVRTSTDYAVVVCDSVQLSTVSHIPNTDAEKAFVVHEGAKLKKLDSVKVGNKASWYKVVTVDNREAWVNAAAVAEI